MIQHAVELRTSLNKESEKCIRIIYTVSKKNCAKLFLSELCQIFTNFDNLLQKDGKETKIMQGALISHLS